MPLSHQPAPFDAHAVGHHQHEPVALHRSHHRQPDAGVARGRLDDRAARLQRARGLGGLDHRQRDAVLDRSARIGALGLDPHLALAEQAAHADVRRAADGVEDRVGSHAVLAGMVERPILASRSPKPRIPTRAVSSVG
jgi:hypothetical protein